MLLLSSIIVRGSKMVRRGDLRYAKDGEKKNGDYAIIPNFVDKLDQCIDDLSDCSELPKTTSELICADARDLDIVNEIDCVITSPPYLNGTNYIRNTKSNYMKKIITSIMLVMAVTAVMAQDNIYSFKVKDDKGTEVSLEQYKGKVLLIVNTATRCGFTPQYKDLEAIYEKYNEQGFEILDFPCNQFGGQAPGTIAEIKEFCSTNYNVKFTQFDKIEVNGENEHPLYTYLKANAENKNNIRWNFTKFLISADGKILKRFESGDKMTDVETAVAQALTPAK